MAIALFVFNNTFRTMINKSSLNVKFNILFILLAVIVISYMFIKQQVSLGVLILTAAIICFASIAIYGPGTLPQYLKLVATVCLPVLITGLRLPEIDLHYVFKSFIRLFNILCIVLLVLGIVDYLTHAGLQLYFANNEIFQQDFAALIYQEYATGIYRYYSFLGHPLTNAWYFLLFYMFNIIYNRYYRTFLNEYMVIIITLLGLLISGSRTALLIGLFMFLFLNNNKYKLALISFVLIFSAGLFSTTLFRQNLLQRFTENMGNITEGRNEALRWVTNGYVKPPAIFTGGGLYNSYIVTDNMGFITSFEYPIIMLFYDIGILSSILFYMALFLIPIYIFVKNKDYFILAFFLLISLYSNGWNALANYSDFTGQFCFMVMLLVNLSTYKKPKGELQADE